jgi:UDP-N-acetylmuramoyl-L-alanyl-D-glutamate--2,6-diaminopimelate ligase
MLNENDLASVLGEVVPAVVVDDIHWKTQESTKSSLLFYRIAEDQKSQELFKERIQGTSFGWLVVNRDHDSRPLNSSIVPEEKWPEIQKSLLDKLYPLPKLRLIAVTGTNGKTTTADLVLQLGEFCDLSGISIGTLGVREKGKTLIDFGLTSPSLIDLRKFLFRYGQGKDFCVLEASSHALSQNRLHGLVFEGAGWLSFSQDHLDYHQTMEEYFAAKSLLVNYLRPGAKLVVPSSESDLFTKISRVTSQVSKADAIEERLPLFFTTRFNRNNLEVAKSLVENVFGVTVPPSYDKILPPDGRFYIRPYGTNFVVVDFAHTPDALENICRGIREAFPDHRLKVLFGCGGDRDRTKRPMMGKIAEAWADEVYVTSDNPRSEDPDRIIDDIVAGFSQKNFQRITDRPLAVKKAFDELRGKEILLLAGKGHENYILIKGVKHPYSDIGEIEKLISGKKP